MSPRTPWGVVRGRVGLARGKNVSAGTLMERLAERHGDRHLIQEDGEGGLQLTYVQAADLLSRAAGSIRPRISPGDRVVVATPNGYGLFLLILAVARAGGVAVPINPSSPPDEVGRVIQDSGARLVVRSLEEVAGGEPVEAAAAEGGDVAALFYTSGTTGMPKGARLTHRSLVGQSTMGTLVPAPFVRTEAVSGMPVAHVAGFSLMAILAGLGVSTYLLRKFRPDTALDAIESRRAGIFVGVPTMYRMMLEAGAERRDLSSVHLWASGADVMPFDLARRFQALGSLFAIPRSGRHVGMAAFVEGYGMVELGGGVALKLLPPGPALPLSGLVGLPLPGCRMRVADDEGRKVVRGEIGELVVKGPGMMKGYHGQEDGSDTFTPDGWLRTGDLARSQRFGLVEFAGRKKDVIKHGGYSVFAVEVQSVLETHPDVAEAAVLGLPDDVKGEVPVAVLRTAPGEPPDGEELMAWMQERLADYKVPTQIRFADELPRTGTNKVRKDELRALFVSEQSASPSG